MLLQRGATPNDIDAFRQQMFLEGLRTGSRQNLNVTDPNSPTARAAAEAMELQNRQKRDEFRQGDEDVIGDKYAPSMGLLGYDEFTVAEQQQMYDDLIEQGYTPAEAQRAVDRQAKTRRATNRIRWGERGAAAPQATGGAPPGVHPITGQPFQGGPQAPAQQPSVNPITGLPF